MKILFRLLCSFLLFLSLISCNEDKPVIAYSPQTLSNPFFTVIADHMREEAEKNGYELLVMDPDMDVKKQSDQIDDFIAKGVRAIVLVPVDRISIGPAVREANAAGIPVFTVDAKCAAEGTEIEGHVGTDNFQGGELAGKAMIEALGEEGGEVLVLDLKKANSCVLRVDGFKKVINAHNKGRTSGSAALQAHEDLAAFFAINDASALGAYTAVSEAKRENRIKIIGFDGMPDGKKAIKKGQIYADPIQHPDKMGQKIVHLIRNYEIGLSFSRETLLPATLYTQKDALEDPDLK